MSTIRKLCPSSSPVLRWRLRCPYSTHHGDRRQNLRHLSRVLSRIEKPANAVKPLHCFLKLKFFDFTLKLKLSKKPRGSAPLKHSIHLSKNKVLTHSRVQEPIQNFKIPFCLTLLACNRSDREVGPKVVGLARVELATPRLSSVCSNHWATSPN